MSTSTIKEAILLCLSEDLPQGGTYNDVFRIILNKNYYSFCKAKTPSKTINAQLWDFIKKKDSRVKRYKNDKNVYVYYLRKNENIAIKPIENNRIELGNIKNSPKNNNSYQERDLHKLLCTYLRQLDVFAKTIFHEHSNKKEENQKWIHPDLVGARFLEYKDEVCQSFFKSINTKDILKLYSYELKTEIKTDYELKRYFFQAVSNSSWANYGYLIAFEIGDNLIDELKRLSTSFGIGFILLKRNPFESEILCPAKERSIDFQAIEKLCVVNPDFKTFITNAEKVISADKKYYDISKESLISDCDEVFNSDIEIEEYCTQKNIPEII